MVLSRRAWLEQTQSEVRHELPQHAAEGQIRKGVVSSIVNFGAFVDLGGVDGLVHVSELSWKHIDHPGEVVEVGQEVTVEVLDVDMDRERVSLSLKATQEDPWQQFARTHQIGQVVPGRVTKLVPFGAFVRVEEGIEGLVHISELGRPARGDPRAGRAGRRRDLRQDHRHRPRPAPDHRCRSSRPTRARSARRSGDDFDPTCYGMPATYDDQGNYVYPDGFDPDTGRVAGRVRHPARVGAPVRRGTLPVRGAPARSPRHATEAQERGPRTARWPRRRRARKLDGSRRASSASDAVSEDSPTGALASDEALAALRDKLSGGQN